jgi:hypothetical protein
MGQLRWLRASDRLERAGSLDRVVSPVQRIVRKIRPGRFRDGLHGVWLGAGWAGWLPPGIRAGAGW